MNLQPSTADNVNLTRRQLFASELALGGHGQVPLSGAGTFVPTNSSYVFYEIDFFTATTVTSAAFRTTASDGSTIYSMNSASYNGIAFPAGYKWFAPVTNITLTSGTGLAYEYKLNPYEFPCDAPLW
jgi:hypothetical protein